MRHALKYALFAVSLCLVGLLVAGSARAEDLRLLDRLRNFASTGPDNSLVIDSSLFRFAGRGTRRRLVTVSEATNIHSHYKAHSARTFRNYTYTGRMRILNPGGGVGVTFYSKYPASDTYYRLRMQDGGSFHIAPHPDGQSTISGTIDSGVVPQALVWQRFKIVVRTFADRTTIRAKVWPQGRVEPRRWQIACVDRGGNRIKQGKPGVWSMGAGGKEWADLVVRLP